MSGVVLAISVVCYLIANIYQNKFSETLNGYLYPMSYFSAVWRAIALAGYIIAVIIAGTISCSPSTVLLGSISGIISIVGGIALLLALAKGPLSLTILIFSMYVVVPPVLAGIFLGQQPTICQLVGIVLIIAVIALINFQPNQANQERKHKSFIWWGLCVVSVILTGIASFIMTLHQTWLPGLEQREFTVVNYIIGIIASLIIAQATRKNEIQKRSAKYVFSFKTFMVPSIIMAITEGGANICNLYNASRLPAIILYPVSQLATLMLTAAFGVVVLKEKLTKITVLCLILGTIAIVIMNF